MPELYPYAAARVHAREPLLLGRQQLEQLLAAKTYEDCLKTLRGFGWDGGDTAEEILAAETEKTWKLMEELLPDPELFRMFRLPVDFNNAKAAVKSAVTQVQPEGVFLPGGSLAPEALLEAAKTGEFSKLPDWMAQPMEKARRLLLQTGDGQACDMLLDRAALEEMLREGERSDCPLLGEYAELFVAAADIKIALRAVKTNRPSSFLPEALASCRSVEKRALIEAARDGMEGLCRYLALTPYGDGAEALAAGASAFDKWRDNRVMSLIRREKANPFTLGPAAAHFLARQNEIAMVRMVLSAKRNGLDREDVEGRLRELYV